MFLSTEELYSLTSYKYSAWQIKWLRCHGYKHEIAANGKPRVLRHYVETLLGNSNHKYKRSETPDLESLGNY